MIIIGPDNIRETVVKFCELLHGEYNYSKMEKDYNLKFIPLTNKTVKIEGYEISGFHVQHSNIEHANGYIIKKDGKSVGFSGDCAPTLEIKEKIKNANVWFLDAEYYKGVNKYHHNIFNLIDYANEQKNKKFYAVHRREYDYISTQKNLILPQEDDEVLI